MWKAKLSRRSRIGSAGVLSCYGPEVITATLPTVCYAEGTPRLGYGRGEDRQSAAAATLLPQRHGNAPIPTPDHRRRPSVFVPLVSFVTFVNQAEPIQSMTVRAARTSGSAPSGPGPFRRLLAALPLCTAWLLLCLSLSPARADTPFVVDEWRFGTQETNAALRYCIDERDPDWPVARRIAAAVAAALLLQAKEYLIGNDPRTADMSGEDLDDTYRTLIQHCDVFFGFKLVPDAYPNWVTITRPYYRSAYVYVVADPAWHALAEMPTNRAIGATVGTSADMRLTQYLLAVTADKRWDKYPMASDEAALQAVLHGTTGAALVWAPALWALRQTDAGLAKLREIAPTPLPVSTADVGAILLSRQAFLRTSIDQAIASLTADGTIAGILKAQNFPGTSWGTPGGTPLGTASGTSPGPSLAAPPGTPSGKLVP
jgi:polar amino acid transport system substrate-binding protein